MEALYLTSRSIDQAKFRQKQIQRKYSQHLNKIQLIVNQKSHPILQQAKQIKKIQQTYKKSKQKARNFRKEQNNLIRKKQNKLLLDKIWNVNSDCKKYSSINSNHQSFKYLSGSNWNYKKKRADSVRDQNKKISENLYIAMKGVDTKQYKKKLSSEIKEYLELRDQIRKFKQTNSATGSSKKKLRHSKSQAKNLQRLKNEQVQNKQYLKKNSSSSHLKSKQEFLIQQDVLNKEKVESQVYIIDGLTGDIIQNTDKNQ